MTVPALVAAATLAFAPIDDVAGNAGVQVRSQLSHVDYTWTITNESAPPVRGVRVPIHHGAEILPPPGWVFEVQDGVLVYRAGRAANALDRGRSADFAVRSPDGGGPVAQSMWIETAGGVIEVAGVWAPGPRPRALVLLVVLGAGGLAALHALVVERADQRRQASSTGK